MKKLLLATLALATFATGANALTLTNAAVTGPSGTIWTTANTGNYTLFLSAPGPGDYLNPNDENISFSVPNGNSRVLLTGEGYKPGETLNSDPTYNLTLSFDGGQMLTGLYTVATNSFSAGSSIMSGGRTFSLAEFSFTRNLANVVQANVVGAGGDPNDYNGNFRISSVAGNVPEPASWAMLIAGFGMTGAAMRRRAASLKSIAA
jgi:hypothetical protein